MDVIFEEIAYNIHAYIDKATSNIKIAVAWFTHEELFRSVINALNRKISVTVVILDDLINRNELALDFSQFIQAGGKLYFSGIRKMHNKFCIIDNKFVLTGSYNWTYYAEKLNWENLVIIDNDLIVEKYIKEFDKICQALKVIEAFIPIRLDEIGDELLLDNYAYMSNDLSLKNKETRDTIERTNREKGRNVFIEKYITEQKYDYRGIPLFQKRCNSSKSERRLVNIHIESIPSHMQNAGRKYVHAQLISNRIFDGDYWVHIIDDEYVEEMRQYFHKQDGGILADTTPLPIIPRELYIPGLKYHFHLSRCVFKDGIELKKYDSKGQLLPYSYKSFYLYARIGESAHDYIGYSSLLEQYRYIVSSLFYPNKTEVINLFSSLPSHENGLCPCSLDDSFWLESFVKKRNNRKRDAICYDKIYKDILGHNLAALWIQSQIIAIIDGGYIKDSNIGSKDYLSSNFNMKGDWVLLRNIHEINQKHEALNLLIRELRGKKQGIVTLYYSGDEYANILRSLGFKAEGPVNQLPDFPPQTDFSNCYIYRLTF